MHIPDGYLSPIFSLGTGAVTVPVWAVAARRVQRILSNRTVPLLAIFSAFSFTIMMFNVPVPGGTTAHGVGGTLLAIVLGPWAAVIGVSVALIIQALFFGDGGILAIFANCLNMGVILPFTGYACYRLLAGRSPLLSNRRVWAAGVGSYVGITLSALAVGIELGLQPVLFSSDGHALYSPYTLNQAIPAMLAAHAFGASIVEAMITALVLVYLQRRHPELLRLRRTGPADEAPVGTAAGWPLWQVVLGLAIVLVALLGVAGLITGGGSPSHAFGADWSRVDRTSIAVMLGVTALLLVVLVPLVRVVLPVRLKGVGALFTALAVLTPLGLIAPGFAYGEGAPGDVRHAFGYVPSGLQQLNGMFTAPLSGYNVPLPFFSGDSAPLWHAALGYELSGMIGMLALGAIFLGVGALLGRVQPAQGNREHVLPPLTPRGVRGGE